MKANHEKHFVEDFNPLLDGKKETLKNYIKAEK